MPRDGAYNPLLKNYPNSIKINSVSIGAETLYTRLLAQSDDLAHYWGEPRQILGQLFTQRWNAGQVTKARVANWISELLEAKLVERYYENGRAYLEIVNCRKAPRADRDPRTLYPKREKHGDTRETPNVPGTNQTNRETEKSQAGDKNLPGGNRKSPPNQTNIPPKPNQNQDQTTSSPKGDKNEPEGFKKWWAAYPNPRKPRRRVNKKECLAKWNKLGCEEQAEVILKTLNNDKASDQWADPQFIPLSMTWLNRGGWDEETTEYGQGNQKQTRPGSGKRGEAGLHQGAPEGGPGRSFTRGERITG